jgi:hypothetical protein
LPFGLGLPLPRPPGVYEQASNLFPTLTQSAFAELDVHNSRRAILAVFLPTIKLSSLDKRFRNFNLGRTDLGSIVCIALLGAAALQIWRENPSPACGFSHQSAFSILAESPKI